MQSWDRLTSEELTSYHSGTSRHVGRKKIDALKGDTRLLGVGDNAKDVVKCRYRSDSLT